MVFLLSDLKKKKVLGDIVRKLSYEHDDGVIEITLKLGDDKQYASALEKLRAQRLVLTTDSLSKANNSGDELLIGQAMLFIMGEYLITDWNVQFVEGEAAPINGENFTTLCAAVGDDDDDAKFIVYITKNFQEMTKEFNAQKEKSNETKKKPSRATTGKKSTQD